MELLESPRAIDPAQTFNALAQWLYEAVIVQKHAPGFLVGLSGTDSIVTFAAAYRALEKSGMAHRLMGVHYAPSEDFLYDHPEAEVHTWFSKQIVPWLQKQFPQAKIVVDTSIDWRHDGLRWGSLMDMSVISEDHGRALRPAEEQYWVVGTRNRSEEVLLNYSNSSTIVSVQPIINLWKSEVLQLSEWLDVPQLAIDKSCETDCICGREGLAARHIREVDHILMSSVGETGSHHLESMDKELRLKLTRFIKEQMQKGRFKLSLPYTPKESIAQTLLSDPLVKAFEKHTLNLKQFNHRQHVYIAWVYLKSMPYEKAFARYVENLVLLLTPAGRIDKFNVDITKKYLTKLNTIVQENPTNNFDKLVEQRPEILTKTSA